MGNIHTVGPNEALVISGKHMQCFADLIANVDEQVDRCCQRTGNLGLFCCYNNNYNARDQVI